VLYQINKLIFTLTIADAEIAQVYAGQHNLFYARCGYFFSLSTAFSMVSLLLAPRASGMVQKVQE
jgi:hypothetical protein